MLAAVLLTAVAGCAAGGGSAAVVDSLPVIAPPSTTAAVSTTTVPIPTTNPTTTILAATTAAATDPAVDASQPPHVDAAAYVVYDVGAHRWMAEHEADAARPVGSLMKLLTAFVVMQAGNPTHVATVPAMQADAAESTIGLFEGERLPRDLLLRAMLIASANDAARTLALDVGGSEAAFVDKMNAAARSLKMVNTVAANPVGLDDAGERSSARDLATLAAILMEDATFRTTVARADARLHGQVFPATNKLLSTYAGATGVKTGHTTDAGYCIVGSATRDGREVIVAVLGAPSEKARIDGAAALLDWAYTH